MKNKREVVPTGAYYEHTSPLQSTVPKASRAPDHQRPEESGTSLPRVRPGSTGGGALEERLPPAGGASLSQAESDRRGVERAQAPARAGAAVRAAGTGKRLVKKSLGQEPPAVVERHTVITQARAQEAALSVRHMCEVLQVNRAWYYAHQQPTPAPMPPADEPALGQALQELAKELARSGYRRMTAALHRMGYQVNHKRVLRLMHALGLVQPPHKRRVVSTTNSKHGLRVYPNLIHELEVSRLNQLWVADLTSIHLPEDFVSLAALLDASSRRCSGWQLSRRLDSQLALDALNQALAERHPPVGWIHHSDRGVQYASHVSVQRLQVAGAQISMSARGTPLDNAQAESFFKTVKVEEVYLHTYQTFEEAQAHLAHFLEEVYNQKRLHSSLGYQPPAEFEAQFSVLS